MLDEETARWNIEHGNKFPYDAGEAWWNADGMQPAPEPYDWAHRAARGVLADLSDRRGISSKLDDIDHDVRSELVQSVAMIIRVSRGSIEDKPEYTEGLVGDGAAILCDGRMMTISEILAALKGSA